LILKKWVIKSKFKKSAGGKMRIYVVLIMLLILLCPLVSAGQNARIEMPDNVVSGEIFQVKLVIDDPMLRELTHRISVSTHGNINLKRNGETSRPNEFEYSGEDEIVFDAVIFSGFREGDEQAAVSFRFYGDVEEMKSKYPDWGMYMGTVGTVSKEVHASPVSFYADLPDLPDGEFKTEYWDKVTYTPSFGYVRASDVNSIYDPMQRYMGSFGREVCYGNVNDDYISCTSIPKEYLDNPKEGMEVSEYYGSPGNTGPSRGYYMFSVDKSKKTLYDDNGEPYDEYSISLGYTSEVVVNDFVIYKTWIAKEIQGVKDVDVDSAVKESLDEFHNIARSQYYTPVGTSSGSYPSVFETELPLEEGPETLYISGSVSDADGNPLPYTKLEARVKGEVFEGIADEHGDFQIPVTIELDDKEKNVKVEFFVILSYERDDTNYFLLYDLDGNTYKNVWYYQELTIVDQGNIEAHIRLDGSQGRDKASSTGDLADMKSLGVIYAHTAEAVDFCLVDLEANIDYKLPVEILVGNNNDNTLYSPGESQILISSNDAGYSNSNRPKNREYHEFAHHLMYANYGGWTSGGKEAGTVNHDGFLNPNTADSFDEGFAEFIALVISDKFGDSNPADGKTKSDIYASFGSLENNYHPWDGKGYDEEFAVASVLWDMYDKKNDNGDSLSLSLYDMWSVLKVQRTDFYDYYVAFREANPSKSAEIDKIFIEHGFFADTTEGNGKRDTFEGFRDANNNRRYDSGEVFFDLGCLNSTSEIEYKKSMVIGKAANYERSNRSTAVRIDGAYLKVKDDEIRQYLVKVHYPDPGYGDDYEYVVDLRDGLLYVQPLPSDVPAQISIEPYSVEYTAEKIYTISNEELIKELEEPEDYFDEHEFSLESTGVTGDMEYVVYNDVEPTYAYEGDLGQEVDVKLSDDELDADNDGGLSLLWLIPLILIGFVASAGFVVMKKSGNLAKSLDLKKAQGKAQKLIKKGSQEFNDKGIPAIRDASKKAADYTAKGAEFASQQTKEGYEKAKPHMKKAQEDIKKKIDETKGKK